MKSIFKSIIGCSFLIAAVACNRDKLKLEPADPRAIKSIEIGDADEAELLQQELGLEINQVQNARLYYFVADQELDQKLIDLGYEIKEENSMQVNYRVVQVSINNKAPEKDKANELREHGIEIINKEDTYWIIRGTLEQLDKIQDLNYVLRIPDKEVRPREVEIVVTAYEDIQKVNELGVDIYSSEQTKGGITIYGGAYDYQIEKMTEMGYKVTRK